MAIDQALAQKPADLDALFQLLRDAGCAVSKRGQSYRLKMPDWERAARLDSLGEGYTLDDLLAVLSGQKEHTPRRKSAVQVTPSGVNLLVDIQDKLRAGKGAGYVRWAKVFNLKQLAQTMNFLTEHNLLDYADLQAETEKAVSAFHNAAAQVKALESRMQAVSSLRGRILDYIKTREVYAAYRKSGYSKRFLEEHEAEIRIHKAAKAAFDRLEVQKLPSLRALQTEYQTLTAEKKRTYAHYRQTRERMRELTAVKANVEWVLGKKLTVREIENHRLI